MKLMKKIMLFALLCLMLSGCSAKKPLDNTRWYTDDINSTVRTVVSFDKETSQLNISFVLIDEGRAERTGVDDLQYVFEKYFYRDFGKNIPEEYNDGTDANAFAVYGTEEDFNADKNSSVTYYHIEDGNLVVNGNVCLPLEGKLAEETDKIIAKNKAAIGE